MNNLSIWQKYLRYNGSSTKLAAERKTHLLTPVGYTIILAIHQKKKYHMMICVKKLKKQSIAGLRGVGQNLNIWFQIT